GDGQLALAIKADIELVGDGPFRSIAGNRGLAVRTGFQAETRGDITDLAAILDPQPRILAAAGDVEILGHGQGAAGDQDIAFRSVARANIDVLPGIHRRLVVDRELALACIADIKPARQLPERVLPGNRDFTGRSGTITDAAGPVLHLAAALDPHRGVARAADVQRGAGIAPAPMWPPS